jgi:pimeloyl-ACP methyl ester carboxylesterase
MKDRWGDAFITVNGLRLECLAIGPPPSDAPTLILLHEGLGCVTMWRDFPERLAKATGCGVFAYSRGGYGASDPVPLPRPLDYMTRAAVADLPPLLDAIGVVNACLTGHSDGATIAAIFAGTLSDQRVSGAVFIAPHFFTEPVGLAAIRAARDAFENGTLRKGLARHHNHPDVAFRGWNDAWLNPDFETWDVTHVLNGIKVPVLAVQGDGDQYGTLRQIEIVTECVGRRAEAHVVPDCGHAPHREQPEILLTAIQSFVARVTT